MLKKVLVIDDSALMRRVMSDIINEDEHFTVREVAKDGQEGLDFLFKEGKTYDVIIVDLHMPRIDGVGFIKEINANSIDVPIIVMSSLASSGAAETIEALELGAFDFVKKPESVLINPVDEFADKIISNLYLACHISDKPPKREKKQKNLSKHRINANGNAATDNESLISDKINSLKKESEKVRRIAELSSCKSDLVTATKVNYDIVPRKNISTISGEKLIVIASSTGGPRALQTVVPMFPADCPYPIVIVQHMPKGFTSSLAVRLNELSKLSVKEAVDGEKLKKGYVYIAQGGKQCEIVVDNNGEHVFSENDKPARGGLKPCADIFFESLVYSRYEEFICGVLTGMGADACKGITQLKDNRKVKVVAQNAETSVVYGMPRAVYVAGVTDAVVPLDEVADTIMKNI